MEVDKAKEFLNFQSKRKIISLCKNFLVLLEDVKDDGCMSDEYYQKLRKKVLDDGNDAVREIEEYHNRLNITF
jgi:predicted esterase YcpF (UPF0227 family)